MKDLEPSKSSLLKNIKGHTFDAKNHNWLIFKEYLSLPFSYMSFVMKDKIEINDKNIPGSIFDPEPYNYVFNRSTSFIDGDFVYKDYQQLKYVLESLKELDSLNLEIIHY